MNFIDYSELEEKIFDALKAYFEKLPSIETDDYDNLFFDIVAQYGVGGQTYLLAGDMFSDLIEAKSETVFEKLNVKEQEEIREFYEKYFLDSSFYDEEKEEFYYTNEDLALCISDRFKAWVDDNYSIDDMMMQEEEEEEKNEE